ncbi:MAG: copper resistance protein B [Mariprofundaceae bacterium]|nr:copper resistance protein B [Mariprofundaceae bacterium]
MRRQTALGTLLLGLSIVASSPMYAGEMEDDPTVLTFLGDRMEWRDTAEGDVLDWDVQGWIGKDLNKFWLKSEGDAQDGSVDNAELQLLYSHAIATFWDVQFGWRTDLEPNPGRDWAVIGIEGLAPYIFEVDAALFIGSSGRAAVRLQAEREFLFTQKLILTPEVEINAHNKNDPVLRTGSGLSDAELGLRLRYEIRREFAPYIGINWEKKFGNTADFARDDGLDSSDFQLVIGIRAWF